MIHFYDTKGEEIGYTLIQLPHDRFNHTWPIIFFDWGTLPRHIDPSGGPSYQVTVYFPHKWPEWGPDVTEVHPRSPARFIGGVRQYPAALQRRVGIDEVMVDNSAQEREEQELNDSITSTMSD